MDRELITLPLRVGVSATRLCVRVTTRAAGTALRLARLALAASPPAEPRAAAPDAAPTSSSLVFDVIIASSPRVPEAPSADALPRRELAPDEAVIEPAPAIPPTHVSEELQFVEAFAEPGAEEGAGATVHVREPWRGYSQMTADEVIVHLADSTPEELGAVALYEGVHRGRKTVLAQARRRLRLATTRT